MWVKICANTCFADAALAAELGADAVGFVFARSKRQVTVAETAAITAALPPHVERIGVFDSEDPAVIVQAALRCGLSAVQLHSEFSERLVGEVRAQLPRSIDIIPTLHWTVADRDTSTAGRMASLLNEIASTRLVRRVLIDSRVNGASGGTGVSFDWQAARPVFSQAADGLQLILAGGLNPENVHDAVEELRPWGVDVASGVEAWPGRKDPARMAAFLQSACSAQKK